MVAPAWYDVEDWLLMVPARERADAAERAKGWCHKAWEASTEVHHRRAWSNLTCWLSGYGFGLMHAVRR